MVLIRGIVLPKSKMAENSIWLDYFVDGEKWVLSAEKKMDGTYALEKYPLSSKMINFKDPFGNEVFFANKEHLWFGGMQGILQVDLEKVTTTSEALEVLITQVRNSEKTMLSLENQLVESVVSFKNNDLQFNFSAPSYQNSEHLKYATFLEGYDDGWSDWTKVANKGYTNLPYGDYLFKVKAKNDFDGQSKVASYSFRINPPWYLTPWAMISYVLLAGFLIWLIIYIRSAQLRKEQIRLEKIVDERTEEIKKQAEEINELYEVKNRFLANISHELRTPLTLILGPAEQMLSSIKEGAQKKQLTWIHQNSKKLLKLINQLLDLSKIEAGKLELQARQQDLVKFCKYICSAFESLAKQKTLISYLSLLLNYCYSLFDAEKLEQVLNNLLNNAFKFTEKGKIKVNVEEIVLNGNPMATIEVKDSGIGIQKNNCLIFLTAFTRQIKVKKQFIREQALAWLCVRSW